MLSSSLRATDSHQVDLDPVKPRSHRRVILPELPSFSLFIDFQYGKTKRSIIRHYGTVQKNSASRKLLLKAASMLIHQEFLIVAHVLGKRRSGRDEFEKNNASS
jgi:hypothetical protein